MEKKIAWILLGLLFLGTTSLYAGEPSKTKAALDKIASIEKRGIVNLFTWPGEAVNAFTTEKKDHPRAWPATYLPRFLANFLTRLGSGVYDILVLPWYAAATNDTTPLTRRFDLPDYVWEKE